MMAYGRERKSESGDFSSLTVRYKALPGFGGHFQCPQSGHLKNAHFRLGANPL